MRRVALPALELPVRLEAPAKYTALVESSLQVVPVPAEELPLKYAAPPEDNVQVEVDPAEALLLNVMLAEAPVEVGAVTPSPVAMKDWLEPEAELFVTPVPLSVRLACVPAVAVTPMVNELLPEIVILPTVMAGVGSVPLMVGVKFVAVLSNVAVTPELFGTVAGFQLLGSDQTETPPPWNVVSPPSHV